MNKPKILLFDIETSPNLAWVWGKYQQDVIEYDKEWQILCYAYKWMGERRVRSESTKSQTEKDLVKKLWKLLDEADIVIAHNGDAFDIKKANAKFLEHGLTPPSGYQSVDTCKVARRYFKFNSNKLNDLARLLNIGEKAKTGGFDLWMGCMNGNPLSWLKMEFYCRKDVDLLEKVYFKLRPWMTNHPNLNIINGTSHACPNCGSHHTQRRGFAVTRTQKYARYQCTDCGAWSKGEREPIDKVIK